MVFERQSSDAREGRATGRFLLSCCFQLHHSDFPLRHVRLHFISLIICLIAYIF